MTEASVSFAGNLSDGPEVRYIEGGVARAMFRVAVVPAGRQRPAGAEAVVLHRGGVA